MADMLANLPYVCAARLDQYYSEVPDELETRGNIIEEDIFIPVFINTHWDQGAPYNDLCQYTGCSTTSNGKYPIGCVAIALAQATAYINSPEVLSNYDVTALKKDKVNYGDREAIETARFINDIAIGCQTNFDCSSSTSTFDKAMYFLQNDNRFKYNGRMYAYKTNGLDREFLLNSLSHKMPVLAGGNQATGPGHAWLFGGLSARKSSGSGSSPIIKEIYSIYCNWGWGGIGDGWYSDYNSPVDQTTFQPLTPQPYKYNNQYIYFNKTRDWGHINN